MTSPKQGLSFLILFLGGGGGGGGGVGRQERETLGMRLIQKVEQWPKAEESQIMHGLMDNCHLL